MGKYYQGKFKPKNPEKCLNTNSGKLPYYRSSWEHSIMLWMDSNQNILRWGSEVFSIPYISTDNLVHQYWPDFIMEVKQTDGTVQKYMIEVKPAQQSEYTEFKTPKSGRRNPAKEMKHALLMETVTKNKKKWISAQEFCDNNGLIFKVLTEGEIFD